MSGLFVDASERPMLTAFHTPARIESSTGVANDTPKHLNSMTQVVPTTSVPFRLIGTSTAV
jgi:hypothetical protein